MSSISNFRAIGYAVLGFALWVMADSCMKMAGEAHLPPLQIIACFGFFGVLIVGGRGILLGKTENLWPKRLHMQLGRSALAVTTGLFNIVALKHLPFTLFYVTVFTAPLMIALLASVFLKERLTWQKALAILAGFIGVLIAINPFTDIDHANWIGFAAAFCSAMCFATSVIWLRRITQSETNESLVFFVALMELICGGIGMIWHAEFVTLRLFLTLSAMGILCTLGSLAVYNSLRYTTAANVSQFHYTQIITGALLGYLIWNEVPTAHLLIGITLIIGSGLYVATHARKTDNLAGLGQI